MPERTPGGERSNQPAPAPATRPDGHQHLSPPPAPQPGVRDDQRRQWNGYNYHSFGPRFNYYGSRYRGPIFVPTSYGYAYPYPYLYEQYYDGDYQYPDPPSGLWSILVYFNGQEVIAYWDPYLGGYWVYDSEWGYVQVQ